MRGSWLTKRGPHEYTLDIARADILRCTTVDGCIVSLLHHLEQSMHACHVTSQKPASRPFLAAVVIRTGTSRDDADTFRQSQRPVPSGAVRYVSPRELDTSSSYDVKDQKIDAVCARLLPIAFKSSSGLPGTLSHLKNDMGRRWYGGQLPTGLLQKYWYE